MTETTEPIAAQAQYTYRAPSGVLVTSCKPEPVYPSLLRVISWSYYNWTRKIIKTQLNKLRRVG